MSILVNTQSEQQEQILLAFLNSLKYDYTTDIKALEDTMREEFVTQYNAEIDAAVADIDAGNFVLHEDVEKLFADRRKVLN